MFRRAVPVVVVALLLSTGLALPSVVWAWTDLNHNRIDDSIERVNSQGWAAGFENNDPTKRMLIGMEAGPPIQYAVYVGYDHKPNAVDQLALSASGVSMVWPFNYV